MSLFNLFGNPDDVPETISAEEMADWSRRAQRANRESPFSRRNTERRERDEDQRGKRWLS